jgi:EAL and modified HD-GYP domain-containing signal transduction protein
MDIYIARQPIFDRAYKVYAYELLYRDSLENVFTGNLSDNVATSLLLMHSYFSFGLENLVGESRAFINFDKHLINHDVAELLDPKKVTIEILETVIPDRAFLGKLEKLKEKGYSIAIDDYVIDYTYKDILDYVDLVKVDFLQNTQAEIQELVIELKKKGLKILAEKVESKEIFEWAKEIGFDYFQGYYFEKPSIQKQMSLNQNAMIYVRLMGELNAEEPDYKKLSSIILTDVTLTYKLLKLSNANSKPLSPIRSITQALAVLGVKSFRRWLSLAMVENMSSQESNELLKFGLIRSSLLQNISMHSNLIKHVEELSLLGILSILDGVLKMDMEKALEALPIDQVLKDTLLKRDTIYKPAMALCFAYEKGVFESVDDYASLLNYDINLLPEHYVEAISWTERMVRELKG